ncbi:ParB N-terminal domain-containing protein [Methylobacterium flocculans]|uniref:ParB N-terminal domain-containing protein n=1 Tax=Methylobacterium flocculans TaxID=2984843 RepID=UPI0021F34167|nr:ParB N-terminal domain-containing protein [Methylobacterium sp. FF17]
MSVHSPAWPVQPLPGVPHLRLSFNDAEWDGTTSFDGSLNRRGIEACTRFHVRRFLSFLHERAPQRILVHCHAGLSRSPALAIVALVHAGMTVEAACQAVAHAVPEASPNRRVVKCADGELDLDSALVDRVVRTFDHRRGAHGAVEQATGHRIVGQAPRHGSFPDAPIPEVAWAQGRRSHTEIVWVRTSGFPMTDNGLSVRTEGPNRYARTELVAVRTLTAYAANARTHGEDQIAQLVALIGQFGFLVPLIVDEHDTIIAGRGRLEAAKRLKMAEVPVIRRPGLSDAQRAALVLADNKVALNSGWNDRVVAEQLAFIEEAIQAGEFEFDLSLLDIGFSEQEVQDYAAVLAPPPEEEEEARDIQVTDEPSVCRAGETWMLGPHRLTVAGASSKDLRAADALILAWERQTRTEASLAGNGMTFKAGVET